MSARDAEFERKRNKSLDSATTFQSLWSELGKEAGYIALGSGWLWNKMACSAFDIQGLLVGLIAEIALLLRWVEVYIK